MLLEDDTPLHVHNPRKIKRNHGGVVVLEPEIKGTRLSLRSAGLGTTLTPYHRVLLNYLFRPDVGAIFYLFVLAGVYVQYSLAVIRFSKNMGRH